MSDVTKAKIAAAHIGMHESEETRAKVSAAAKKRIGSLNPMWGKRGPQTSQWMRRGPLGQGWKGGVTPENLIARNRSDYDAWRTAVFARDDFTCAICGARGRKLEAHHMDCFADFSEKRLDVDNGITFCVACHKQFHLKYGKLHNRRWQADEFVLEAMSKSVAGATQPMPLDDLFATLEVYQVT